MSEKMKDLKKDVERLIEEELERANHNFPLFRSRHEGVGVIGEEMWEAWKEVKWMCQCYEQLREETFEDYNNIDAAELGMYAKNLACEAIQVAAMAKKFAMYEEARK